MLKLCWDRIKEAKQKKTLKLQTLLINLKVLEKQIDLGLQSKELSKMILEPQQKVN